MMKKYLILWLFMVVSWLNVAYAHDYQFDPKDEHHFLYIPEGKGPFPAILLLHASTGIDPVNHDWARLLKNHGYVVYLIDSFKPRGCVSFP
jgi:dienelactone hydrolase